METDKELNQVSLDDAAPGEQMAAVDAAMRRCFDEEAWINARGKVFPGLKRLKVG